MFPKAIKKFLVKRWGLKEEELKEELLEKEHYIVWYCGIDHIVDREKTPIAIVIDKDFCLYILDKKHKKSANVVINYKDDISFFHNALVDFVEIYYEGQAFEMRVIHIPDGMYYLEFKLDEKYSYVYQQIWNLDDEDIDNLKKFTLAKYEEPTKVRFEEIFRKISIGDDMLL